MKSIALLALLAVSASASADEISSAAIFCMAHMRGGDGTHPADYVVGFEACAPLVAKAIAVWQINSDKQKREQEAHEIEEINKALQAAGLPLLSE
jgi:hypothetical protein